MGEVVKGDEKKSYQVSEVYTPTTPARVTFVDRVSVNDRLVDALDTPGMQLVVFGPSGTGKTTLLTNKLKQVYENHITTRCMKSTKFDDLVLDAFSQLGQFYVSESGAAVKSSLSFELAGKYREINAKINSTSVRDDSQKSVRYVPPQLTAQTLGKLLGEAKACWVLEDFHIIAESEKPFLAQMMKVFMDLSDEYNSLKIIAIGAVDTGRQVVQYDSEMKNRVAEIRVDVMTDDELLSIITKGEEALNIEIPETLRRFVVIHANGLPATCHHICLKMCRSAGILNTCPERVGITKAHCESGLSRYVEECSDSIKLVFDNALRDRRKSKYQQPSLILYALTFFDTHGASRQNILSRIRLTDKDFPETSLKTLLSKLVSVEYSEILRYDANSAKYSFADPVYKAYAMARLKHERAGGSKQGSEVSKVNLSEILEELTQLLANMKERPPKEGFGFSNSKH